MRIVNSTPNMLKENLDSAIQEAVSDFKENYHINNHNTDFSRKRVLTMETVINLLLSMQGGSSSWIRENMKRWQRVFPEVLRLRKSRNYITPVGELKRRSVS